ncbi:MAG: hypothetical protein HQ559_07240 [Lentisphaerae bacterium]|nr:hypothetical protein [Lentisphaerota bacterium]
MNVRTSAAVVLLFAGMALSLPAAPQERSRLYTKPDPSAGGGIRGSVKRPPVPIAQILAIPPDEPRLVYEGSITGTLNRHFEFRGLPMRRYDLVVIYDDQFYEGLRLQREENTLTTEDRRKIDAIIQKSEPFFTKKIIHRLEGTTGRGNFARCICTFFRDRAAEAYSGGAIQGYRRTFKLVILKDVGPGWQVVRTRDLYPLTVPKSGLRPKYHFSGGIQGVRVSDYVKELGDLDLGR